MRQTVRKISDCLLLLLHTLMKRYSLSSWIDHAESFALPFLQLKTNMTDPALVDVLKNDLRNAGLERVMMTEGDDELTAITSGSDAYQIYEQLIERCNKDISIAILGQTMTTIDGSSRAQGEVHENTENQITLSDMAFVENVINSEFIPRLINLGYPLEGARFAFDTAREASNPERINTMTLLLNHYKVDPSAIKDQFNIDVEFKHNSANV